MGGLGISSVPHLTIASPLVNRSCSSRWNYRRCQSPHKGCRLAPASKLIIREDPGSHPSRLTQSLQQATPPFRCSLYFQFNTYMIPSLLLSNLAPQLGSTTLHFFPTKLCRISLLALCPFKRRNPNVYAAFQICNLLSTIVQISHHAININHEKEFRVLAKN